MKKAKIHTFRVVNEYDTPVTLWLEPSRRDYTLLANETFEVEAASFDADFHFSFQLSKEAYIVYPKGESEYVIVLQNNQPLEFGHNRQHSPNFSK